jgi:putative FmdB family regulatory protein
MPIYEFRCAKCRRRTSVFVRGFSGVGAPPACEHCGNPETTRVFSTFALGKSSNPDIADQAESMMQHSKMLTSQSPELMAQALRDANASRGPDPELEEMLGRMDKGEAPDDLYDALTGEGFHSYDNEDQDGGGGDGGSEGSSEPL